MEDVMFEINNTLVTINSQIYIADTKVSELEGIAMKKRKRTKSNLQNKKN